jgi:type IV pilus assembly protein PilE
MAKNKAASRCPRGFTLIEVMIVVAVIALLSTIAYPAYTQYVFRARVMPGLDALSALSIRLEQRFQDVGGYGTFDDGNIDLVGTCGVSLGQAANFTITCVASHAGARFLAVATGSGPAAGVVYSIDHAGTRRTTAHPKGVPAAACWSVRGTTCDS